MSAYETLLNKLPDQDEASMTKEELDREWLLSINKGSRGKIRSEEIHTILPPPPRFIAIAQPINIFFFAGPQPQKDMKGDLEAMFQAVKNDHIDILMVSLRPYASDLSSFLVSIKSCIQRGCRVRLAFADPKSKYAGIHPNHEEHQQRIDDLLKHLKELHHSLSKEDRARLQVFLVDFPLYCSTYRIGPTTLVVPHLFSQPSSEAPVFLCTEGNPLFQSYVNQLQQVVQSQYTHNII